MDIDATRLDNLCVWLKGAGFDHESRELESIIKESQQGWGNSPARKAPRWPGDPGDAYIKEQSKSLDKIQQQPSKTADWMQVGLDIIGLVPGVGEPFDALNSAIHAVRGNPLMSFLSAISAIPIYGDVIGKGTKLLLWGIKTGKTMQFGAKTYTATSLGGMLKKNLDKVNEADVKALANEIDNKTKQPKGTMWSLYIKKVKEPINKAAADEIA
mgnify:CR=1 FL=1